MTDLKPQDFETLNKRGKTPDRVQNELQMLRTGFPSLCIDAAATPGNGILCLSQEQIEKYCAAWERYSKTESKIVKMVPASGAASRMFKNLFNFTDQPDDAPIDDYMQLFCDEIEKFAFFEQLNHDLTVTENKSVATLFAEGKHRDVVRMLIGSDGLNYGHLPKGLLKFHKMLGNNRTPVEEHLAEGAQYAQSSDGVVRIHFTVSQDHINLFKTKIEEVKGVLEHRYGVKYEITMSVQKPSTDTVAANIDGTPYRENGELFFRPGGHGALIENLADIDADVVFIKNIDNVVPDYHRGDTVKYKCAIAGVLVEVRKQIFDAVRELKSTIPTRARMIEFLDLLRKTLCIGHDNAENMTDTELKQYLLRKLDRPLRVCGMVRNEGEPGGGPFLAYNSDGTVSPQILESSQIDMTDSRAVDILKNSGHFNPVDLVCSTCDETGKRYNLSDFVDSSTGFISRKSRAGHEILALELPGLWNGAMSDWNTVFVEVPASTFNPVKSVNDLLRSAHQPI